MPNLTPERITELWKLCEEATKGPWTVDGQGDPEIKDPQNWWITNQVCSGVNDDDDSGDRNARFIAEARTALPELLRAYEEKCKEVKELEAQIVDWQVACGPDDGVRDPGSMTPALLCRMLARLEAEVEARLP